MRFLDFYHKYGFVILFILALLCIFIIFIINITHNKPGSYDTNNVKLMYKLFDPQHITSQISDDNIQPHTKPQLLFESKGESECRRVLEKLFKKPFPRKRPSFLRNIISDSNLELDCFNEELKIAVEYNGIQHYKFTPAFHKNKEAFYNIRYRDEMKQRLCKENNILLITVPYTIQLHNIESYIIDNLQNSLTNR